MEVLGHGTFGVTYLATKLYGKNAKAGEKVCIKEFFIQGVCSREESGIVTYGSETISIKQCKEEFIAEAKNLIELNHPNIVKAHELFEANETYYYSMDYIEGENLNSYLKHNNVTLQEATSIITRIAYGLSYMHESQHMLHLDLKPGNIMRRSSDGQIIIIDFGLSRFFTEEGAPEEAAMIGLGTKGYAPVEQTKFKNNRQDFKASIDVYALGATFYKLITGETPFPAEEYLAHPRLLEDKLRSIGVPEKTINVVTKAMHPEPKQRYQSVMSFIYDLDSDERKRRNKSIAYSVVGLVAAIIIILAVIRSIIWINSAPARYYDSVTDYVFILSETDPGNKYGSIEDYKFCPDGTGVYKKLSWEGDKYSTDTATFVFQVKGKDIIFPRYILSDYRIEGSLTINVSIHKIILDQQRVFISNEDRYTDEDEYYPNVIVEVNWDKMKNLLNK